MNENLKIKKDDLQFIRSLKDFDLTMLLSEIHDHGWESAETILTQMKQLDKEGKL